jgi:hypothetical protein
VQQAAAQIPSVHNCIILDKIKDPKERLWYLCTSSIDGLQSLPIRVCRTGNRQVGDSMSEGNDHALLDRAAGGIPSPERLQEASAPHLPDQLQTDSNAEPVRRLDADAAMRRDYLQVTAASATSSAKTTRPLPVTSKPWSATSPRTA